jgi:hypothetical protein
MADHRMSDVRGRMSETSIGHSASSGLPTDPWHRFSVESDLPHPMSDF